MSQDTKYSITGGQQGAVGDNAVAHDFHQAQVVQTPKQSVDLQALASELETVSREAQNRADDPEHQVAIGAVNAAKASAQKGDEVRTIQFLKSAGKWVLDIATDMGAKLAAEIIKKQMGMP